MVNSSLECATHSTCMENCRDNLKAHMAYTMICGGEPMKRPVLFPCRRSLVSIADLGRDGRLGCTKPFPNHELQFEVHAATGASSYCFPRAPTLANTYGVEAVLKNENRPRCRHNDKWLGGEQAEYDPAYALRHERLRHAHRLIGVLP